MSKGRRTPPLFEVLGGADRRPGPTAAGPVVNRPVQVRIPPSNGSVNGTASISPGERGAATRSRSSPQWFQRPVLWFGVTGALVLVAAAWYFAYHMGHDQAARDFVPKDLTNVTPNSGTSVPPIAQTPPVEPPAVTPDPDVTAHKPDPKPETPEIPADPRKVGVNYLHIATLPYKDAEQAVAYLNKGGVKVTAVPAKKVDPKQARDKNLPHLIFALEGVPSGKYSDMAKFRNELEKKVRDLGQKFQQKERGASDFAAPYWVSYTGK
jgi:hypothetical protein